MKMKSTFLTILLLVTTLVASMPITVPKIINPFIEKDTIYVSDYGFYASGEDWQPAIQKAIDDAYKRGIPQVVVSKELTVNSPINLKEGVTLKGGYNAGFFNGMRWYTDENNSVSVPKIKAGKDFAGGILEYTYTANDKGVSVENIVIDANKKADYGISVQSNSLRELNVNLKDLGVQGAKKDGISLNRVLTTKVLNCNISANNGYGINFSVGASDSTLIGNYIHGNQTGGIRMAGGSYYNQISAGKIEDNYGTGILFDGANGGSNRHIVSNVIFHVNNGPAIAAVNGASAIVSVSQFTRSGVTQTNELSTNILTRGTGSLLQVDGSQFSVGDKTIYNASAIEDSKILLSDSLVDKADAFSGNVIRNNVTTQ